MIASLKVRLPVEIFCRLAVLGLAIFMAPTLFYMCLDFRDAIERGYPISAEAIVTPTWSLARCGRGFGRPLICRLRLARLLVTTCFSIHRIRSKGSGTKSLFCPNQNVSCPCGLRNSKGSGLNRKDTDLTSAAKMARTQPPALSTWRRQASKLSK